MYSNLLKNNASFVLRFSSTYVIPKDARRPPESKNVDGEHLFLLAGLEDDGGNGRRSEAAETRFKACRDITIDPFRNYRRQFR